LVFFLHIYYSIANIIRFSPHIIQNIKLQDKKDKKQESEKHFKEKGKIAKKRNKEKVGNQTFVRIISQCRISFSVFTAPHKSLLIV